MKTTKTYTKQQQQLSHTKTNGNNFKTAVSKYKLIKTHTKTNTTNKNI